MTVRQSGDPIPPCVAGALDERRVLADGTIVDTHDTWSETDGVRTLSRSATAYAPDGTVVGAYVTDAPTNGDPTGTVPMSIDELVALVSAPGVRITAPVPPGTPNPPESCSTDGESPEIDKATARRMGAALARVRLDGVTLDRPLGELRPGDSAMAGCVSRSWWGRRAVNRG